MGERPPRYSWVLLAVVAAGGAGLGLIAVGTVSGNYWYLQIPGFVLVIATLPVIYLLQRREVRRADSVASRAAHVRARRPTPR